MMHLNPRHPTSRASVLNQRSTKMGFTLSQHWISIVHSQNNLYTIIRETKIHQQDRLLYILRGNTNVYMHCVYFFFSLSMLGQRIDALNSRLVKQLFDRHYALACGLCQNLLVIIFDTTFTYDCMQSYYYT